MNIAFNEVAMAVLKRPLQDCSLTELQQLADQYPYFGPAHLLLAKKLQEENPASYEEQVQKTSLYFQNRLWLHHLLNDNDVPEIIIENKQGPEMTAEEQDKTGVIPGNREENVIEQTGESIPVVSLSAELVAEHSIQDEIATEPAGKETTKQNEVTVDIAQLKIEPLSPGAELSFEPYHTVDYFASQGIKFKEEERPKDRFGQQLKSFTEWLKAMKRVPATEVAGAVDVNNERKIEQLAEYSIAERHVITEAMAEVWEKQGNKAKAEEIYRKLSLLDPSKSSYFAAKIDELKKTS
ncbi:MAG: hypothetical protein Q8941_05775 [Bacteroidota bacterium]|nr:hypothetical protein [Bacteroidota bacterium]